MVLLLTLVSASFYLSSRADWLWRRLLFTGRSSHNAFNLSAKLRRRRRADVLSESTRPSDKSLVGTYGRPHPGGGGVLMYSALTAASSSRAIGHGGSGSQLSARCHSAHLIPT